MLFFLDKKEPKTQEQTPNPFPSLPTVQRISWSDFKGFHSVCSLPLARVFVIGVFPAKAGIQKK